MKKQINFQVDEVTLERTWRIPKNLLSEFLRQCLKRAGEDENFVYEILRPTPPKATRGGKEKENK